MARSDPARGSRCGQQASSLVSRRSRSPKSRMGSVPIEDPRVHWAGAVRCFGSGLAYLSERTACRAPANLRKLTGYANPVWIKNSVGPRHTSLEKPSMLFFRPLLRELRLPLFLEWSAPPQERRAVCPRSRDRHPSGGWPSPPIPARGLSHSIESALIDQRQTSRTYLTNTAVCCRCLLEETPLSSPLGKGGRDAQGVNRYHPSSFPLTEDTATMRSTRGLSLQVPPSYQGERQGEVALPS